MDDGSVPPTGFNQVAGQSIPDLRLSGATAGPNAGLALGDTVATPSSGLMGGQSGPGGPIGSSGASPRPPIVPKTEGMLTQGLKPDLTVPGGQSTSSQLVSSGTTGTTDAGGKSWWEKLMGSGKTMDLAIAGMGGYAKAGIAKDDREYQERVNRENAAGWQAADPNAISKINVNFPSQNRG